MNSFWKTLLFLLVSTPLFLHATPLDVNHIGDEMSILRHASCFLDTQSLGFKEIEGKLRPYHSETINLGVSKDAVWIAIDLHNKSSEEVTKLLVVTSPILESIELYSGDDQTPNRKGIRYIDEEHTTLYPSYTLTLPPHTTTRYTLKIQSLYGPVDFALELKDEKSYLSHDRHMQITISLLVGIVVAFMAYSMVIFVYSGDKSYLFYSLYLLALLYQQAAYLGLTQLTLPSWFTGRIEVYMPITKVALMIITSALFAMHFLKINQLPHLHRIYKFFIIMALIQMVFFNNSYFYNLNYIIILGIFLIFFNQWAAVQSYRHGNKQARLFITGFATVFVSYLMMISDALGLSSFMQEYLNIMMWGTALEATILTLAFTDRYAILQAQKTQADKEIILQAKNKERIIQEEVEAKTAQLALALETKDFLLQEVHHRVKNNLQIILSLIRLQSNSLTSGELQSKLQDLDNRINAIAKTYDKLIIKENLENIEMKGYIDELIHDISMSIDTKLPITITTDVDAVIALRESVYVGLVVNELVTNAYKHAFGEEGGAIKLTLKQTQNNYLLIVEDNGKGFDSSQKSRSLGMRLIHTIVTSQLEGVITQNTLGGCRYHIEFTIHNTAKSHKRGGNP